MEMMYDKLRRFDLYIDTLFNYVGVLPGTHRISFATRLIRGRSG